jgi:sugar/nucleoside kinase (ribokinase family)/phosphoglycolate phosphatase-like HAD superfamily hydrolase
MTRDVLRHVMQQIPSTRIAVLGDVCLDVYMFLADNSEISVETGLPTRIVRTVRTSLGGAGNVAANCAVLGAGAVHLLGVVGDDLYGREIVEHCRKLGIDPAGVIVQSTDWRTNVYTKLYRDDQEEPRIDIGTLNCIDSGTAKALLSALEACLAEVDAVILNQQVLNGLYSPEFRDGVSRIIRARPDTPFLLDTRHYPDDFPGTIRKINAREAWSLVRRIENGTGSGGATGPDDTPDLDNVPDLDHVQAGEIALSLADRWSQTVYLTRGEDGCIVANQNTVTVLPALEIHGPADPVGAGDSMIAGIAVATALGRSPVDAATLGGFVAGVTVQKKFITGTATPDEVLEIGCDPDYRYNPELSREPRRARYQKDSGLEIVSGPPERLFRYAVFDHDGTVSTVREGWEQVMAPMMYEAITGERAGDLSSRRRAAVTLAVDEFIDRTTGYQTMYQMEGLVSLVREFGYVPGDRVRTAAEYKAIFNERLLRMVNRRLDRLRSGELAVPDVTLKNAVPFLQALREKGIVLYLASGTDEADVRAEARLLGYAGLFSGGIYGSVGDITRDPKRVVLERILQEIGPEKAGAIVTFGDGPVEIRETRKAGGFAVGVASDEVRRYGLNTVKRERVIRAGADCVIADYSEMDRILEYLGLGAARREAHRA